MRSRIYKHRKLLAIIALPSVLAAWILFEIGLYFTAPLRGRLVAHFDLARGHYRILAYGLPPPYRNEYARLLRERYGIEYRQDALCIVSPSLANYIDSYDEVSVAAATRKFGRAMFKETEEAARARWSAAHPQNLW